MCSAVIVALIFLSILSANASTLRQNGVEEVTADRAGAQVKPPVQMQLQEVVDQMWELDAADRVDQSVVRVDWQQQLHAHDRAEKLGPLLVVSDESFLQRPLYAALADIYGQKLFHAPTCQEEPPMGQQRRAKFDRFWTLVTQSDVFKAAYKYLDSLGKTGGDFDKFTSELFDRWFGLYSRCRRRNAENWAADLNRTPKRRPHQSPTNGSSGWEHVFSGEWKGDIVDGHHNWVRYYLEQKAGDIDYHGYYARANKDAIGTIQYNWGGHTKQKGGFLIRTSPAFDFSLLTVCMLGHTGPQKCRFKIQGSDCFVTSYLQDCAVGGQDKHNFCLATAYPGLM